MHFNAFHMTGENSWKRNVNKGSLCIFTGKLDIFLDMYNVHLVYANVHTVIHVLCTWPIKRTILLINHLILTSFLNVHVSQFPRKDLNKRFLPRLLQHESLCPIGLKSARIEIPHTGSHTLDFSKTDYY